MPTQDYKLKSGQRVSGVTTIIGSNLGWNTRPLMYWAWNEGREGRDYRDTSKAACESGTITHALIEAELKGRIYEYPKDTTKEVLQKAATAYQAWLEWRELVGFELLHSELSLVSEEYEFGGTIDIAAIKKVPAIVDIKTSSGVYADHKIQIAAYGQLYNEHYPDNPIRAYYLLQLGKNDGAFAYHYWPELNNAWEAFKCCLQLHGLKKKIK